MQSHLNIYATGDLWEYQESKQGTEIHQFKEPYKEATAQIAINYPPPPLANHCNRFIIHQRAHTESTQTIKFHNNVSNPHLDQFCNADALQMIQLKQRARSWAFLRIVDQQHGALYYMRIRFSLTFDESRHFSERSHAWSHAPAPDEVKVPCMSSMQILLFTANF
jgi:hypothetical protein